MGILDAVSKLGGAEPLAAPLPDDLQPSQQALVPGLAFTSAAASRAAPLTNLARHNILVVLAVLGTIQNTIQCS